METGETQAEHPKPISAINTQTVSTIEAPVSPCFLPAPTGMPADARSLIPQTATPPETPRARSIDIITAEIHQLEAEANSAASETLQRNLDIGRRLIEAKKLLPHGQFLPWTKKEFGWTPRTSQLYMEIARNAKQCFALPPDASLRMALAAIALPKKGGGFMGEDAPAAAPELPVTRPGDLWLLPTGGEDDGRGPHRLLCGDATACDAVSRLLGAGSGIPQPLLCVTDAPYGVDLDPEWRVEAGLEARSLQKGRVANDDRHDWSAAYRLFPGDVIYAWHAGIYAGEVEGTLQACNFEIRAQIIWNKQRSVISRGPYHWKHEPCWYAVRKGKTANWIGGRSESTVWDVDNLNSLGGRREAENEATGHGTQKPVELMRRPILNHTQPGEPVYDPFLGSGSTLIAAETTGRVCYGIDIDPRWVDRVVLRWQRFTGRQAVLEGDGRTFDQIAQEIRQEAA